MINIYIDADACPVVEETIDIAFSFGLEVIIVCDMSHVISYEDVETIYCDQGSDSVDYKILQKVNNNDIVVTQDYGLAAMLLAKGVHPISQNGLRYTNENMDTLLEQRSMSAKLRKHQRVSGHIKKRTAKDDTMFIAAMTTLIQEIMR